MPLKGGIAPPPFSTWCSTVAASGFSSSRFGPTLPCPFAASRTWQPPHEALSQAALPAARSTLAPPLVVAGAVDVVDVTPVCVCVGDSPAAELSLDSLPKTATAASIATKKSAHTARKAGRFLPGKFGR